MNIEIKDLIEFGFITAAIIAAWNKIASKHEKLEDKMLTLEKRYDKELTDINGTMENIIKTNQTLMNAVTELNVHTADFLKRDNENWERNEKNFERIFNKIEQFDEGIKKFYRDNSQFNTSGN